MSALQCLLGLKRVLLQAIRGITGLGSLPPPNKLIFDTLKPPLSLKLENPDTPQLPEGPPFLLEGAWCGETNAEAWLLPLYRFPVSFEGWDIGSMSAVCMRIVGTGSGSVSSTFGSMQSSLRRFSEPEFRRMRSSLQDIQRPSQKAPSEPETRNNTFTKQAQLTQAWASTKTCVDHLLA